MEKIIVAGIGTETGKTVASAILCEALEADYWKPVQAGDLENSDSITARRLISNSKTTIHPESYRLNTPMSPHAAAEIDGIEINPASITIPETDNNLVIELAGGLMVPLSKNYLNIDWVEKTSLSVVLVSNYYLGSINHTLLSLELLKVRKIPIHGLIFNGQKNQSTFDVIMHRTAASCLLEIGREKEITAKTTSKYAGQLKF